MRSRRISAVIVLLVCMLACSLLPGAGRQEEKPQLLPSAAPGDMAVQNTAVTRSSPPPADTAAPTAVTQAALPSGPCPENTGKLLFAADSKTAPDQATNFDIYVAGADGSGITLLTENPIWDGYPSWSPDLCRVAYSASITRESQTEIYVMNADGSGAARLTVDPAQDREPSWSPDGSRIVFTRDRGSGDRDLYVINADGSSLFQLTDDPAEDEKPEWSPDGDWIVFQSRREGNADLYLVRSDGTGLTRLTDHRLQDTHAAWSPDGKQLAFISNRSDYIEVYVMNRDGSGVRQVTHTALTSPSPNIELSWSRVGNRLAFGCDTFVDNPLVNSSEDICVVNPDGSGLAVLIDFAMHPSRQPDW